MATSTIETTNRPAPPRIGVVRLATAGAVTAAAVFVLCWVGTFVPLASPTHAYINLFTTADASSARALAEGSLWSLLFGGLTGGVFAWVYNFAAVLSRP